MNDTFAAQEQAEQTYRDRPSVSCPPWHFLPGPYSDDEGRTGCSNRETHGAQRAAYDADLIQRDTDGKRDAERAGL